MKHPNGKSESLKKALNHTNPPFDEAEYYESAMVEMGGDDVLEDTEETEDSEADEPDDEGPYSDED